MSTGAPRFPIEERVLALASAGQSIPPDLIVPWQTERREAYEDLRDRDPVEARAALEEEIRGLEEQVEVLEEGGGSPPDQARRSLALGMRIRRLLWLLDRLSGDAAADPLPFLEEEIDWIERSALDVRSWDERQGAEADGVLGGIERLRSSIARRKLERFLRPAGRAAEGLPEDGRSSWVRVSESFRIELPHVLLEAGPAGEDLRAGLEVLRSRRREDIERCAAWVSSAPPAEAVSFARVAIADLADESSAVISENATARRAERIPALRLFCKKVDALKRALAGARRLLGKSPLPDPDRSALRKDLRLLGRIRRRCRLARLEAEAAWRIEGLLGPRWMGIYENLIGALVVGFLLLVIIEWRLPEDSPRLTAVYAIDLVFCLFFQVDFLLRWASARWSGRYFLRHFFLESLPALPYGLLFHFLGRTGQWGPLEEVRAVVAVRLLGLRSVFLVLVRISRVLFFLVRGIDRVVERFRGLLDRDVVIFDRPPAAERTDPARRSLLALEDLRRRLVRNTCSDLPWEARASLLAGHLGALDAESKVVPPEAPRPRSAAAAAGEIHLGRLIDRLLDCDEGSAVALLGPEGVRRTARWLRFLDIPLLRHFPVVRRLVPAARIPHPPEAIAAAANASGQLLQRLLGAVRFWGDLSGITTGPQVLDRIATAMIEASRRPAVRLLLFGGAFVLLKGLVELLGARFLDWPTEKLSRVLGLPLIILGSLCLVFLLLGRWFKAIAGEALDVYLRTADAHFYSLLKTWKAGRRSDDLRALYRAVFLPERRVRPGSCAAEEEWVRSIEATLDHPSPISSGEGPPPSGLPRAAPPQAPPGSGGDCREELEMAALLYRDYLDGPILQRADDKTSVQLLGNLTIGEVRSRTLGLERRDLRRLERLDLEKERLLGPSPYFWFRFIAESLAIETAKLVLEYNTSCIPLDRLETAPPEARRLRDEFFAVREGGLREARKRRTARAMRRFGDPLVTARFTSLDFLVPEPSREEEIGRVFGGPVLDAMRADRILMVREIFGTHPYHLLPRSERVLNPYRLYRRYLSGARLFLLPVFAAWGAVRLAAMGLLRIVDLVREVLGKERAIERDLPRTAEFDVAVRKLNRMRKPLFLEAVKLRAAVDLEYLGVRLPGTRAPASPGLREDLDFIGAIESERRPLEKRRGAALRDLRRFRNFLAGKGWFEEGFEGLLRRLDPSGGLEGRRGEAARALVTAFVADEGGLRSRIIAPEEARRFFEKALETKETLGSRTAALLAAPVRWISASGRRRAKLFAEYAAGMGELGRLAPFLRRKARRAFLRAGPEMERLVAIALERARRERLGEDAIFEDLRRAALDHPSWTRKVLTTRALQTIAVLDVRSYRDLIFAAGGYGGERADLPPSIHGEVGLSPAPQAIPLPEDRPPPSASAAAIPPASRSDASS
jgi:hypothetical protein